MLRSLDHFAHLLERFAALLDLSSERAFCVHDWLVDLDGAVAGVGFWFLGPYELQVLLLLRD